jgi:hypothetical protein
MAGTLLVPTSHFKVYNNWTTCSNFFCGQAGCQRDLRVLRRFGRHVFAEHAQSDTVTKCSSDVSSGSEKSQKPVNSVDADAIDLDDMDLDTAHDVDAGPFSDDKYFKHKTLWSLEYLDSTLCLSVKFLTVSLHLIQTQYLLYIRLHPV